MGTGRPTGGGHLAKDSLPVRDQGISTSGSQEEPPVCDPAFNPPDVNLNGSQVGNGCRERGMGAGARARANQGLRDFFYSKFTSKFPTAAHMDQCNCREALLRRQCGPWDKDGAGKLAWVFADGNV
ncbi:hypothetical protein EYF80_017090 [Liparis tanakae]|uniref:Uncharacterized protein n=1 Tax=Liparis tanakae TaxID=230148 RepID=A0A4Z2I4E6_9TELE|nr:hypothetical protein EYF80_017090 [Liparis tanakae]